MSARAETLKRPATENDRKQYVYFVDKWDTQITRELSNLSSLPNDQIPKRRIELMYELDSLWYAKEVLLDIKLPREKLLIPKPLKPRPDELPKK